jgi:hypothetical protein
MPGEAFEVVRSRTHGDVQAVLTTMDRLGFERLLSSRRCPEAAVVTAMVAARVIAPHTKLATTRWWQTRTLAEEFGVQQATEDDLYAAMDWLLDRQIASQLRPRDGRPGPSRRGLRVSRQRQ